MLDCLWCLSFGDLGVLVVCVLCIIDFVLVVCYLCLFKFGLGGCSALFSLLFICSFKSCLGHTGLDCCFGWS